MNKTYICPHCGEEYFSGQNETRDFCEYECPRCDAGVEFEGNEK